MENETPVSVPVTPPVTPAPKKGGRILLLIGIAVVLLLLIAALIAYLFVAQRGKPSLSGVEDTFNQNNISNAVGESDALLAKDPNNVMALITKSGALAQKGSLEFQEQLYGGQAGDLAKKATELAPNNSEAWRVLAYSYEIQQKYPEAHQNYQKAIKLDPKNARALFGDAHVYNLEGDVAKAEAGYRAAIAADAGLAVAHAGLGNVLLGKGDLDGALTEFQSAHSLAKNIHEKAEAAYSIGLVLTAKKDFTNALTSAQEATQLDGIYPLAWYGLGKVQLEQSEDLTSNMPLADRGALIKTAIANFNNAMKLNPNQSIAFYDETVALSLLGQFDIAFKIEAAGEAAVPKDITLSAPQKAELLKRFTTVKTAMTALQASVNKKK